jgi:hypothetical protein
MRFRGVLNTHQRQSDTLYTMRDEGGRDRKSASEQGALVLQANKEEAVVRAIQLTPVLSAGGLSLSWIAPSIQTAVMSLAAFTMWGR